MTVKADQDVYALHNDETFVQRLTIAVVSVAHTIISEADTTPHHERRLVWARKALADPRDVAAVVASLVVPVAVSLSDVATKPQ